MPLKWYAISPFTNPESNALEAFRDTENASEMKPVPIESGRKIFNSTQLLLDEQDARAAAQLGLTGLASFAGGIESRVLIQDFAYWTQADAIDNPIGDKIFGTIWGASIRVIVSIHKQSANLNLTLPAIAAASELGLVRSSYEITALGFSAPDFMLNLPGPGRFDSNSWHSIQGIGTDFLRTYAIDAKPNRRNELQGVPLQVRLKELPLPPPLDEAKQYVKAVRLLDRRLTLSKAIREGSLTGIPESVVNDVYSRIGGITESTERPNRRDKSARDWLNV